MASTRCRSATPADVVLLPGSTQDVAAIARLCNEHRMPLVVRGAGTGYSGGAVPVRGGVVLSMERFDKILQIDVENLLAVVQPNVVTARAAGRGRGSRALLPARPGESGSVVARRQRRPVRRRPSHGEVRHDETVCARARSRVAHRRGDPHRRQDGETRRWLRRDAAAGRIRGNARDSHGDHLAAGAQAGRSGDDAGDVCRHRRCGPCSLRSAGGAGRASDGRDRRPAVDCGSGAPSWTSRWRPQARQRC